MKYTKIHQDLRFIYCWYFKHVYCGSNKIQDLGFDLWQIPHKILTRMDVTNCYILLWGKCVCMVAIVLIRV